MGRPDAGRQLPLHTWIKGCGSTPGGGAGHEGPAVRKAFLSPSLQTGGRRQCRAWGLGTGVSRCPPPGRELLLPSVASSFLPTNSLCTPLQPVLSSQHPPASPNSWGACIQRGGGGGTRRPPGSTALSPPSCRPRCFPPRGRVPVLEGLMRSLPQAGGSDRQMED